MSGRHEIDGNYMPAASDERSNPVCREHGPYWPLFNVDGEPVCPDCIASEVEAGRLTFSDPEQATADVCDFGARSRIAGTEGDRLHRVITAFWARERRALQQRVRQLIEERTSPETYGLPQLVDVETVARLFHKSPQWVRSRPTNLPAPVKVGKSLYWRLDAIATIVGASAQ
jgi:hypothetical protein